MQKLVGALGEISGPSTYVVLNHQDEDSSFYLKVPMVLFRFVLGPWNDITYIGCKKGGVLSHICS